MESIGEKLKNAREMKGLSHDQISRETNIARSYLQALESEDFSAFPGEPYLVGFMRNYAEYLGLKPEELVSIYKNMKIQEQPVPVQELLRKKGTKPIVYFGAVVGGALIIALILLLVLGGAGRSKDGEMSSLPAVRREYTIDQSPFEKRFYEGDSVLFHYKNNSYVLSFASLKGFVTLDTPLGKMQISLGEETNIDLDKDNQGELSVFVSDLTKDNPLKGSVVRFESILPRPAQEAEAAQSQAAQTQVQAGQPAQAVPSSDPTVLEANKPQPLVEAKSSPYPFTMNVTFRGYCMFRYEIDRRDRDERYYHKTEQISVSANNTIKIWLSNASACVVQIVAGGKSTNLELGVPGEVSVKQVKWVQNDSGGYALGAYGVN